MSFIEFLSKSPSHAGLDRLFLDLYIGKLNVNVEKWWFGIFIIESMSEGLGEFIYLWLSNCIQSMPKHINFSTNSK